MNWSAFLSAFPQAAMQGANWYQNMDQTRQMNPMLLEQQRMQNQQTSQMNPLLLEHQRLQNRGMSQGQGQRGTEFGQNQGLLNALGSLGALGQGGGMGGGNMNQPYYQSGGVMAPGMNQGQGAGQPQSYGGGWYVGPYGIPLPQLPELPSVPSLPGLPGMGQSGGQSGGSSSPYGQSQTSGAGQGTSQAPQDWSLLSLLGQPSGQNPLMDFYRMFGAQ